MIETEPRPSSRTRAYGWVTVNVDSERAYAIARVRVRLTGDLAWSLGALRDRLRALRAEPEEAQWPP